MTYSMRTSDGLFVTVYVTLRDFAEREVLDALDDLGKDFVEYALIQALGDAGHIVWEDGWDGENFRLDRQGFRWSDQMVAEAEEGYNPTFWSFVDKFDREEAGE